MLSLNNANAKTVVNDRQDRMYVAGIYALSSAGLRCLRLHASRVLRGSAHPLGLKPAVLLNSQGAIRTLVLFMSSALESRRTWRPAQPVGLPAFVFSS